MLVKSNDKKLFPCREVPLTPPVFYRDTLQYPSSILRHFQLMPLENGTLSQGTNRLGEKLETSSSGIFPRHIQGEVLEPIPESGVASDLGRLFSLSHNNRAHFVLIVYLHGQDDNVAPPSFAQSEFQTVRPARHRPELTMPLLTTIHSQIIRRQRHGNDPDGLKIRHHPSRSPHLKHDWEFAVREAPLFPRRLSYLHNNRDGVQ